MSARKYVWTGDEIETSQCVECIHYYGDGTCAAFPEGVPESILLNQFRHVSAYPGDRGILFAQEPE